MPRRRTLTGQSIRSQPNWQPLIDLVGLDVVDWFMWMGALELSDGSIVHAYKHRATRRYFHLSESGQAFEYTPRDSYAVIDPDEAAYEAFFDRKNLWPEPDAAELAAFERLTSGVAGHEAS